MAGNGKSPMNGGFNSTDKWSIFHQTVFDCKRVRHFTDYCMAFCSRIPPTEGTHSPVITVGLLLKWIHVSCTWQETTAIVWSSLNGSEHFYSWKQSDFAGVIALCLHTHITNWRVILSKGHSGLQRSAIGQLYHPFVFASYDITSYHIISYIISHASNIISCHII